MKKKCGRWRSVAAICRRWQRRYRRKGFGKNRALPSLLRNDRARGRT
jgi:hypothetical protein